MLSFPALETLFIYGGRKNETDLGNVGALSLSGYAVGCPDVASLPYAVSNIKGLSLHGQPVLCGGYT